MNEYAPQSYYDEVIALFSASGFKLLTQVEINTGDLPYHVSVVRAQDTSLVFYYPGRACILRLVHHEYLSVFGDDSPLKQYWSLALSVEFPDEREEAASKYQPSMLNFQEQGFTFQPKFEGFDHCGWSSHGQLQHRWNAECSSWDKALTPYLVHDGIVPTLVAGLLPWLSTQPMTSLWLDWPPTYCFSGPQKQDNEKEKQACEALYWSRVKPEAFKIIRTLIKRIT